MELEKKSAVDKNGAANGNDAKMETDENDGAKMSCVEKNGVDEKEKSKKIIKFPTCSDPLKFFLL